MRRNVGLNHIATVILLAELTIIGGVVLSMIAIIANQPPGFVSPTAA